MIKNVVLEDDAERTALGLGRRIRERLAQKGAKKSNSGKGRRHQTISHDLPRSQ
jgi:hypothetical protein